MRAVVQRVSHAYVEVENEKISEIRQGYLIYLGVEKEDRDNDLNYIVKKVIGLRIFSDEKDKMNLAVKDVLGEVLVVSQFTLYGDVRKGNRPSFTLSANSEMGKAYYEAFIKALEKEGLIVKTGKFQSHMKVHSINDGPVTILLDSRKTF